jgi:hypothetical protein
MHAFFDSNTATHTGTRPNVRVIGDRHVMFQNGSAVHQNVLADLTSRLDNGARQYLNADANQNLSINGCRWMAIVQKGFARLHRSDKSTPAKVRITNGADPVHQLCIGITLSGQPVVITQPLQVARLVRRRWAYAA